MDAGCWEEPRLGTVAPPFCPLLHGLADSAGRLRGQEEMASQKLGVAEFQKGGNGHTVAHSRDI